MSSREYHYSDILLQPKMSKCYSRSEVSLATSFGGYLFKAPYCPANMKTVIDRELALEFARNHYFYTLHRFMDYGEIVEFVEACKHEGIVSSISLGVKKRDSALIKTLAEENLIPDFVTIDIAHGHSENMRNMIANVKYVLPNTFLIAGNVCTRVAAEKLHDWGADAVKVGVGPGHACTTKLMTGFSRPQFSTVLDCSHYYEYTKALDAIVRLSKFPIIADGGIEHPGDIAKALVAGATMVMCGHMLAGFEESPGDVTIHADGRRTKSYYGSASEDNKQAKKNVEGRKLEIPLKGSIWDKIQEINESLQSSCSYAGVDKSSELHGAVEWVVQK